MNYFLDTEFLEGTQKTWFGNSKPTIDLISIGIVSEDNREYYAISKDFNLKEAWNRFDWKKHNSIHKEDEGKILHQKVYWIRENVLKPLMQDAEYRWNFPSRPNNKFKGRFDYKDFVYIINKYGKSNKQIAEEVYKFIYPEYNKKEKYFGTINMFNNNFVTNYWVKDTYLNPKFYGYYSDYDWVVFCWLFGKMINLPKGFPMYCIDLKQILDEKAEPLGLFRQSIPFVSLTGRKKEDMSKEEWLKCIKLHTDYPKQTNEHNSLSDAKWNKQLFEFLNKL